ncbi:unnamed protein product [Cochlearia groenlandica]
MVEAEREFVEKAEACTVEAANVTNLRRFGEGLCNVIDTDFISDELIIVVAAASEEEHNLARKREEDHS